MKPLNHLLLLSLLNSTSLSAEEPKTFTRAEITAPAAQAIVNVAISEAEKRKEVVAVAVCDLGGHPIAFLRMDAAKPAVVKIALDKAWSSAVYRATTGKLWEISQPGEPAAGLASVDRTITFQGGIPVNFEGAVVGGVGVSGAAAHIDEEIARTAVEKIFGKQESESAN